MKFLNILAALSLILFIGCGGESDEQQQTESTTSTTETEDVRTIEIIGIDNMKFAVEEDQEGISVGESTSDDLLLLESITAQPGDTLRIVLTTQSQLPASAMSHNWLLLTQEADVQAFVSAAGKAVDNDYVPAEMTDQILAQTGMAAGGETVEVTFTVPEETGTYEYICSFIGHYSAGMRGDLIVEESSAM